MSNHKTAFCAELFFKSNVGTDQDRSDLLQQIRQQEAMSSVFDYSNPGCTRLKGDCKNIDWLFESINELLVDAVEFYNLKDNVFQNLNLSKEATINYWVNINTPGSRNTFHTHKEDDFSCVYYIQGTDTGDLRFPNPANILGDCSKFSPFTRDFMFAPKDGDLILFPSWLAHEVEPNLSSRERINIAFNFRLKQ